MPKVKRKIYEVKGEIRERKNALLKLRAGRAWIPSRKARETEQDLIEQIAWLEGYLQAVRDERGLE